MQLRDTIHRHGPVLLGVTFVLITVIVLLPITGRMNARMEAFKEELVARIQELTGQPVRYSRIAPSILRYVQIEDLRLGRADETPVLAVQRLRVYYDIRAILRGQVSTAVTDVRIDNSRVYVDPNRQRELFDALSRFRGDSPRDALGEIVVGGRNVEVRFLENGTSVSAEHCFFEVELGPDSLAVELRGQLEYSDERFPLLGTATADVNLSGSISPDFAWANGQVSLRDARTDLFEVGTQEFQIDLDDGVIDVRRIRGEEPVDILLSAELASGGMSGRILADGFDPRDVVTLKGPIAAVQDQLPRDVSGSIHLDFALTDDGPTYGIDLDAAFVHPAVSGPVRFTGTVRGTEERANFRKFGLSTDYGYAQFTGNLDLETFLPAGALTVENAAVADMAPLTGDFEIRRVGDAVYLTSEEITYAGVDVTRVLASASPRTERSPFSVQAEFAGAGELRVEGSLSLVAMPRFTATVRARSLGLTEMLTVYEGATGAAPVSAEDVARYRPSVTATARGWVEEDDFQFELPRISIRSEVDPRDRIVFSGLLSAERLAVEEISASFAGFSGNGEVVAERGTGGRISFETDFQIEGIRYALAGEYTPGRSLNIDGLYGVEARLLTPPRNATRFWVSAGEIPLPAVGDRQPALLSFDVDGAFRDLSEWEAIVRELTVTRLPLPQENEARVTLQAALGPTGGEIDALRFEDSFSSVEGTGRVDYVLENVPSLSASLVAGADEEQYTLDLEYGKQAISGDFTFEDSPVGRLGFQAMRGNVVGSAEFSGTFAEPRVAVEMALPEGRFNADPVSASFAASLGREALTVRSVELQYLTTRIEDGSADLDFRTGRLEAAARYVESTEVREADVLAELSAVFDTSAGNFWLSDLWKRKFHADLRLSNLPARSGGPREWTLRFARDETGVRLEGGPKDSIRGYLAESGEFELRTVAPFPVSFSADGTVAAGQIETNLNRLRTDLERFPGLTDLGVVRFVAGTASGSVRIVGPINDPDFYGTLVVTDSSAEVELIPEIVNAEKAYLVFQEKVMRLVPFELVAGAAEAQMEGSFLLNRWGFEDYRLLIDVPSDPGLHIAYDFNAVEVDGFTRGQLEINGTPSSVRFSGNLTAQSTAITLSEEVVETEDDGEIYDTIADLTIETGKGLEFFWPTNNFPILRAFAETGETIELDYSSVDGSFALRGDVGIQGGELFYFDRNFYVRSGSIRFREDELEFDPELTVEAEIRDIAAEGPVRIYLTAENRPLSEFSPQFTSDPPMSEAEIASILGGNIMTTDGSERNDLSQAAFLATDIFTQWAFVRSLEGSVRRALGLDLFTVRTHLFPNLVRVGFEGAYPLDNTSQSLGKYLDNTTIFLGKYLGTDLFLELLVQLRAENPLQSDVRNLGGLSVDSEFSLEWKTPFFLLEWNFFPRSPETLFLTDNSFVFSWEYSF